MSRLGNYANKTNLRSILIFNLQYWNQKLAQHYLPTKYFSLEKQICVTMRSLPFGIVKSYIVIST